MPPKRRRFDLKRKRREHPVVEHWTVLAGISKNLAGLFKQEQQYTALLQQIAAITNHDAFVKELPADVPPQTPWLDTFRFSQETATQIKSYVEWWVGTLLADVRDAHQARDEALANLKNADVADDDALKKSACFLAEAEMCVNTIDTTLKKWCKIVRFQPDNLLEHTSQWLDRWLKQWEFARNSIETRLAQFKETYKALESIF
jgi:hypothetical protein|tara:strand:+ start:3658 stop:4266 length:609 start_codon:yes stop_codon:yes gene_type:complete